MLEPNLAETELGIRGAAEQTCLTCVDRLFSIGHAGFLGEMRPSWSEKERFGLAKMVRPNPPWMQPRGK